MNNLFKLTPTIGTIKNGIKLNHLPKMSFCSVDSQKNYEKSTNSILLLGRMGGAPQVRGTAENTPVFFSMATNFTYTVDGERANRVDWHNVTVFSPQLRQQVQSFGRKGAQVLVMGRVAYNEYVAPDGKQRNITNIIANEVTFVRN